MNRAQQVFLACALVAVLGGDVLRSFNPGGRSADADDAVKATDISPDVDEKSLGGRVHVSYCTA